MSHEDRLACSGNPDPCVHAWYDAYPIEVCGNCGVERAYLENDWCKKAGTRHELGWFRKCRCKLCGEDVHDWDCEAAESDIPSEPAKIFTSCRRCGYKNPRYESQKKYSADVCQIRHMRDEANRDLDSTSSR